MAEFNCLVAPDDAPLLEQTVTRPGIVLIDDARSSDGNLSRLNSRSLVGLNPYPHGAYVYFSSDIHQIRTTRLSAKNAPNAFFFIVEELHLPEHLRVSLFMRGVSHVGVFSVSHHPAFLSEDGSTTSLASSRLKSLYRGMKREAVRHALRIKINGRTYFVLPGAAKALASGIGSTTYGERFDQDVVAAMRQ